MAEPTTAIPNWASAATFTSGPETGLSPTTPFLAGEITQGMKPGLVVARKLNWLFRTITQWLSYLNAQTLNVVDGGSRTLIGNCTVTGGLHSSITLNPETLTLGSVEYAHTVNIVNSIHTGTCSAANLTTTGTLSNSWQFTCTGTETHSGAETHNGSVTFAGASFKLLGRDKGSTQQYGFYADNMTVADGGYSAYNLSTVYVGNILNLIVKPGDKLGATVTVKSEYSSTQNILVKTDAGALTLASIAPGTSCTFCVFDMGAGALGWR